MDRACGDLLPCHAIGSFRLTTISKRQMQFQHEHAPTASLHRNPVTRNLCTAIRGQIPGAAHSTEQDDFETTL